MFLQVGLAEEDRPYHCIMWRNMEANRRPDIFEFQRLIFGDKSSPYLAQDVCRHHVESYAEIFPEAAKTIIDAMYMDDVMDSVTDIPTAIKLRRDLTELFALAGMRIHKWCSNETVVLEDIPEDDRVTDVHLENGQLPTIKTLGVLWQSNDDVFTFRFIPLSANEVFTKRKVASLVAKMFDPFQVLAPYSIRAKIMLQQTWLREIGWDDPLPEDLSLSWTDWLKHLPKLEAIRLNRCLTQSGKQVNAANIHTFVDASEVAYATTSYLRQQYISGEVSVFFIAAKSRVAPLKVISVPRLELKGAVIGLRLSRFVGQSLQIPVNKHIFWSDSQNVIYWIRNESHSFKPFVANRIGEIHESTFPEQWRHIPGNLNPSDKATRGLSADEFVKDTTWLYGSSFLYEDQSKWPEQHYDVPEDAMKAKRSVSESYSTLLSEPWIC